MVYLCLIVANQAFLFGQQTTLFEFLLGRLLISRNLFVFFDLVADAGTSALCNIFFTDREMAPSLDIIFFQNIGK